MQDRPAWYRHRFNTATSLRWILTIIPWVPRFLVPPIAVLTTAVCIAAMPHERRAASRNLRRISGRRGWPLRRGVWALFYNFARLMVSYCDLPQLSAAELQASIDADPAALTRLRGALEAGKGLIVLTAHLGNWEIGARVLEQAGSPVHVVMQVDRMNAAERWLSRLRERGGVHVEAMSGGPADVLGLRASLARNGILAMQGDRAPGQRTITQSLFGAPFALPRGPFLLAHGCGAPLVTAFVVQRGWRRWRAEIGEPFWLER
ncbi:MAG TPA: lysophospholipid acyltransferase family protein, partial [Candidatus Polarisedimenticolaceae bacterium]|nr:lysophospholipid acyltransferase family protein [Candidatus Polarisedimenticolaceae bacterium]